LPELLSYLKFTSLYRNLIIVVIIGVISAIVYFLATRLYFRHLSTGLIVRDEGEKMVKQIIKHIGGQENIKHVEADVTSLVITVYDKEIVHEKELMDLGSISITHDENVYTLLYGAKSYFLQKGIINSLRTVM
ncbi:MAG: PTS transporter subunit EIIB, partial [Solobacterium sp.]|nr:PTS transporter subunit EIIB [Solobacterium sp.]